MIRLATPFERSAFHFSIGKGSRGVRTREAAQARLLEDAEGRQTESVLIGRCGCVDVWMGGWVAFKICVRRSANVGCLSHRVNGMESRRGPLSHNASIATSRRRAGARAGRHVPSYLPLPANSGSALLSPTPLQSGALCFPSSSSSVSHVCISSMRHQLQSSYCGQCIA